MIRPDTPVLVVPNDIPAKAWRSIMSCPWSKLARDSKDGTFTYVVSFVTPGAFKFYADYVTPLNRKKRTRKEGGSNA